MLERKCSTGVEKLRVLIGEHLQNGIPASDLLEKTLSFFTLRKTLLSHNGYSKCSRDILRLFPTSDEDVEPLWQDDIKDFHDLFTSLDYWLFEPPHLLLSPDCTCIFILFFAFTSWHEKEMICLFSVSCKSVDNFKMQCIVRSSCTAKGFL